MSRLDPDDPYWLPGVLFEVDGVSVPARELSWAMISSCGCTAGVHLMTQETVTEEMAWKAMGSNAAMTKQDKARGFVLKLAKTREIPFDDCPHSPKWGYVPPPTPVGFAWATTTTARALHLVPLTALDKDEAEALNREWQQDGYDKVKTLCGSNKGCPWEWSRKRWRTDGKVECTRCINRVMRQTLPLDLVATS